VLFVGTYRLFSERNGPFNICSRSDGTSEDDKRSPLLLQFLDAVHQIHIQFPDAFEFNSDLLVFLADHVDSGLFGTFLNSSQRARIVIDHVIEYTQSVWSYVLTYKSSFLQSDVTYAAGYQIVNDVIWPVATVSRLQLWWRYFGRWFPECHPTTKVGWHDDW
jgi:myotubularin-related protein 1/2